MAGKVDVPKIICLKELNLGQFNQKIVPIAVKKIQSQPVQKFRLPMKNLGNSEAEVEF